MAAVRANGGGVVREVDTAETEFGGKETIECIFDPAARVIASCVFCLWLQCTPSACSVYSAFSCSFTIPYTVCVRLGDLKGCGLRGLILDRCA